MGPLLLRLLRHLLPLWVLVQWRWVLMVGLALQLLRLRLELWGRLLQCLAHAPSLVWLRCRGQRALARRALPVPLRLLLVLRLLRRRHVRALRVVVVWRGAGRCRIQLLLRRRRALLLVGWSRVGGLLLLLPTHRVVAGHPAQRLLLLLGVRAPLLRRCWRAHAAHRRLEQRPAWLAGTCSRQGQRARQMCERTAGSARQLHARQLAGLAGSCAAGRRHGPAGGTAQLATRLARGVGAAARAATDPCRNRSRRWRAAAHLWLGNRWGREARSEC